MNKKQPPPTTLPPLPREHGAWAMFLVPLVIGLGVGWSQSALSNTANLGLILILFWLTALCFFLARFPLMSLVKARDSKTQANALYWSGIYISIALVGGIVLVMTTQVWWWVLIGAVAGVLLASNLWLATRRLEMSVGGEWTAIAGAALSAPGAYLAIARVLDLTAVMLFLLNFLFFGGTVYYIKFKVREQPRVTTAASDWRVRLLAARAPIFYCLIALIIAVLFYFVGWLPGFGIIALLVPLPKVIIGALERPRHVNLPRLGMIEVAHSIAFALVVLWALR